LGLAFVWESVASLLGTDAVKVGREVVDIPRKRSWMIASPVLALALIPLFGNWTSSTRRSDTTTADFAHDMLNSVEPYGLLVTVGDNDTFPLWYAQEVEGIRKDVIVANTSLLNTEWYTRQIIRNPVRPYDMDAGPAIYKGKAWPAPKGPPVKMTMDQADSIPLAYQLPDTVAFEAGNIKTKIAPRVLTRADIFVLQMIKDNPGRAVYFSRTSGGYGRELGLEQYLLTQGLARKLLDHMPTMSRDTVMVPGEGYVDLARTKVLWEEIFAAPKAFQRKDGWPDKASVGIPALYVSTGFMLYDALQASGDLVGANNALKDAKQVAQSTRISEFFNFDAGAAPPSPAVPGDVRPAVPLDVSPKDAPLKK
jgi:hypothetical protein